MSYMEHAVRIVRDVVTFHRRRGAKWDASIEAASKDLMIEPGRARNLYYREPLRKGVVASEYEQLMTRWGDHLDAKMAALQLEFEATQRQRANLSADAERWRSSGTSSPNGRSGERDEP